MLDVHRVELPIALPFHETPAVLDFQPDGTVRVQPLCYTSPLAWSFTGNAVHIRKTFDPFIRGLQGGPRDQPEPPKRSRVHAALSIPLGVAVPLVCSGLVGGLQGVFLPQVWIASDVAKDEIQRAVPALASQPAEAATYRGKVIPYEFRLDGDWKPAPIPATATTTDFMFDYRGGLGKLEINAQPGVKFANLFSDSLPETYRASVETIVRTQLPNATVELAGSRWVELNGVQWREVTLVQRYGATLSETRTILTYSGPPGSLEVHLILPNHEHYAAIRDGVATTIQAPPTVLDQLLSAERSGTPVEYRGKQAPYRITLNSAWKSRDMNKGLAEMGRDGERIKEMIGEGPDLDFAMGEPPSLATLEIGTNVGEVEIAGVTQADCEELLQARQVMMETGLPGFQFRLDLTGHKLVKIAGRDWIEIRATQTATKGTFSRETKLLFHITSLKGRILGMTAEVSRDHPEVWRIVAEALDSARIDE